MEDHMILQRGARGKLDQHLDCQRAIDISMRLSGPAVYDCTCFGLDSDGRLSDDRYMVFYNQPRSPEGAVLWENLPDGASFTVDLGKLPTSIGRLSFTVSIDGAGTMGELGSLDLGISQDGASCLSMALSGSDFAQETAIIVLELYKKDGVWRYGAVASGFNGGLGDLLRNFGGEEETSAPASQPAPQPAPVPPVPAPNSAPRDTSAGKVSLKKGEKVSLKKKGGKPLTSVMVGLGWDEAKRGRRAIDCDASAILCQDGKYKSSKDLVCYMHLKHSSKAVRHMGDNLTGAGEGDDEQIYVKLASLPARYDRVVFVVNIYCARERRQDFGMIANAFIRLVDDESGAELCRYDLSGDYAGRTAMILGEVLRDSSGEWVFHAIGEGTGDNSINALAKRFK